MRGAAYTNGHAPMDTGDKHYFRNGFPCAPFAYAAPVPGLVNGAPLGAEVSSAVAAPRLPVSQPSKAATAPPQRAPGDADVSALRAALENAGGGCIRLFVAGAVTHVGKTTVCLSILAALRQAGLKAAELAYIKPATQCEAPDLLMRWCGTEGIEYVSGENAPLVFYQGFTRSFLAGEQGTSAHWLEKIARRVDEMSVGRRVVLVDGVGFPSVGSIVGVDNADVALASRAPVLLVCKSGVGAAVDSFSLNSTYFQSKGVPVLGAVFNMGDLEGFNSWDKCAENLERWFALRRRRERYYGVVPMAPKLEGLRERIGEHGPAELQVLAALNASHFARHVNLAGIVEDASLDAWCRHSIPGPAKRRRVVLQAPQPLPAQGPAPMQVEVPFQPKSRSEVASAAKALGARGGG